MIKPIILFFLIIIIGTFGYFLIEKWNILECLYMTVITIFTVGFREVRPLTPTGRIFTIFIIFSGVSTAFYAFTKIAEIAFEGGIRKFWRKRMNEKKLKTISNHYLVCGYGRMGQIVQERLMMENIPHVVIENNREKIHNLEKKNCLYIEGDATLEEVLIQAGVKRAKGLAALLPTDADNLYLVLTARQLNPSLYILSKALDEEGEKKILQIGANKVVSPYKLGGLKIAQGLIRPTLVDFIDLIIRRQELSLFMEEFVVSKQSKIVGLSLKEADIRRKSNVIVMAVRKPGKEICFNPAPETKIEVGDTLLVLGNGKGIQDFKTNFLS
ncbi:potassium channel protein [Candidatus Aminicenantes bacterium AC-335-B20]|jgi:voltage-gated potassium channel|nr:potassium channel protein [SCandidatus Aminicenantes bacterium Aminicenantia_JdfR_composite]MCP2596343.1 potassium channel protein [Candidatus Aminicenantes bacterium AC-335-G13]MCP2599011.1 potassium channel protein [Candidatus Aminicenantes bacterium AC-335-B20]MCP2605416.1 potassium channel protein [Candidatus Aminicenantes bacterium AC-335-O07]MCP2617817.1 potassium channel protein [Candidatus Aminicenantes bacterium AC-335-A11]